jgi:hypothetical protein
LVAPLFCHLLCNNRSVPSKHSLPPESEIKFQDACGLRRSPELSTSYFTFVSSWLS